mmetsp:Transcript_105942/g.257361  ORF Transcript_105942/g.257361 Transcript_105942/m.257361 type:complete len:341 (-) Transcript_105942:1246-2268(-)
MVAALKDDVRATFHEQERLIFGAGLLVHRHGKLVLRVERDAPRLFDTVRDERDRRVSLLVQVHAGHVALVLDSLGTIAVLDVKRPIPFLKFVAAGIVRSIVPEWLVVAPAHEGVGRGVGVREPLVHGEACATIFHFLAEAEWQGLALDSIPLLALDVKDLANLATIGLFVHFLGLNHFRGIVKRCRVLESAHTVDATQRVRGKDHIDFVADLNFKLIATLGLGIGPVELGHPVLLSLNTVLLDHSNGHPVVPRLSELGIVKFHVVNRSFVLVALGRLLNGLDDGGFGSIGVQVALGELMRALCGRVLEFVQHAVTANVGCGHLILRERPRFVRADAGRRS